MKWSLSTTIFKILLTYCVVELLGFLWGHCCCPHGQFQWHYHDSMTLAIFQWTRHDDSRWCLDDWRLKSQWLRLSLRPLSRVGHRLLHFGSLSKLTQDLLVFTIQIFLRWKILRKLNWMPKIKVSGSIRMNFCCVFGKKSSNGVLPVSPRFGS